MKKLLALLMAFILTFQLATPVFAEEPEETQAATEAVEVETEAPVTEAPTTEPPVPETAAPEETSAPTEPQPTTEVTEATASTEETIATTEPTEPTLDLFAEDGNVIASGECGADGDNLTWKLTEDGTLTISGEGKMKEYVDTNDDGGPWNTYRSQITAVVLEPGVVSIGYEAFHFCKSMKSVIIPEGVTSIGHYAFCGCQSLTSVTIPEGTTSIGVNAFLGCRSLTSVVIPESVTSIPWHAFEDCSSLTSVIIPGSTTDIGGNAFKGCSSLTSITIPKNVLKIGSCAFEGCTGLMSVTISKGVTGISVAAFSGCSRLTSVVIPESVTCIDRSVFEDCTSLISVTIPEGVTRIDAFAFKGCSSLTSVVIPESVTSIGWYAFNGCSSLTSITIPKYVFSIDSGTFKDCTGLIWVTIPEWVTSIGNKAFEGCSSLGSVIIPKWVDNIGSEAFKGCSSLLSIDIPEEVTKISNSTFFGCSSLTNIIIPSGVTSIESAAFFGCEELSHVSYGGSDLQWRDIKIGDNNESLTNASIHYSTVHPHNTEHIPGKVASCTEAGNREYWHCLDCDEYFADADCTQVISEVDTVLPALGHDMAKVEAVAPTYVAAGNNEYYTCSRCGKAFKDEQGEIETTVEEETLPKLDKGIEIRPVDTSTLSSGRKLTLTAWAMPDNKKAKAKWSLASGDEAYASISSSGVLTAKAVSEVQNITVIATPTDGSPEARKEIQILPKIAVKQTEKLNLFYGNGKAKLAITGGQVTSAQFVEPSDFVLDNNDGQFYIRLAEGASAKPKTKVTLEITLPGCDTPIKQPLTIATTNTAPKLKLNPTASIVNTTLTESLTVETAILGTEDTLTAWSATKGVTASADNGILTLTLDTLKTTTATVYLKGSDWAKEIRLTHKITVTDKKPTVKLSAKGKLDVLNPESEIVYTPKLTNATGTIESVRLEGADAELFNAEVVDGLVHLKLAKSGENYSTRKTYKVTPVVTLLGKDIAAPTLSIKVTQSALKLAKLPNRTVYQSQTAPLAVKLTVTSPARAKIGDVQLNAKTTAAFRNALENAGGIQADEATVSFPAKAFAALKPGRYTVILDVFPSNAASDTKRIQARFTLTVQK